MHLPGAALAVPAHADVLPIFDLAPTIHWTVADERNGGWALCPSPRPSARIMYKPNLAGHAMLCPFVRREESNKKI